MFDTIICDISDIYVQVKFSIVKKKDDYATIVSAISKYANTQNKVNNADFSANNPILVELEKVSRYVMTPITPERSMQTYWFFDDGTCKTLIKMDGKETTWNGNWDYSDGILTVSGAGGDGTHYSTDLRLYWYGNDEFEVRFADIGQYEGMLSKPDGVRSVNCRYEPNGVFHTRIVIESQGNESAVISVQSPQIYEREAESE